MTSDVYRVLSDMPPDDHVTRCDLRIPNEVYGEIEELAIANGARLHHRSGKPVVTPTILELINIGLAHRGEALPDRVSDSLSDASLVDTRIEKTIAPLITRLEAIEQKINTIPENSPSRMASEARNEPVRTNHPEAKAEAVTEAETMRCPKCGSGDIKKTGYTQWTDKKTGKKYRSAARRQCKECKKSFSIPFPETIEV